MRPTKHRLRLGRHETGEKTKNKGEKKPFVANRKQLNDYSNEWNTHAIPSAALFSLALEFGRILRGYYGDRHVTYAGVDVCVECV